VISIIVPAFNRWDLTHARFLELYQHVSHHDIEVIYSDDASTEGEVLSGLRWWQTSKLLPLEVVFNPKNRGFGATCNQGAEHAQGDSLIFLSNDVLISGNFVWQVLDVLERNSNALIGNTLYAYDTGWNVLAINGKKQLFPYLGGYFIACTAQVWEHLGGFDPIFLPYDYEDIDLCTTAQYLLHPLVPINSEYLQHLSGQTIRTVNTQREKITLRNQKRFIEKWSKIL